MVNEFVNQRELRAPAAFRGAKKILQNPEKMNATPTASASAAAAIAEEWKSVPGYEGYYEISTLGNIRSLERKLQTQRLVDGKAPISVSYSVKSKLLRSSVPTHKDKYIRVDLCKDQRRRTHDLHRLLALAFLPNPDGHKYVDHIDRNNRNNNLSNLRWVPAYVNCGNRERVTKSGHAGIYSRGDKFFTNFRRNKVYYRKTFDTLEEAKAYVAEINGQIHLAFSSPCTAPASDVPPSPSSEVAASDDDHRSC